MTAADHVAAALADRYRVERELGQGGMATVYLARDLKHEREVAIKVLKPELAAVLGAERFVTEIKTTAALQHPNILPLFDSGEADGFLYYVMPYVEGETLRTKLDRETQLGVEESVQLIREVADALQYAHEHGVVHRDIKPENILLHAGRPMVADFGIALAVSAAAGGRMTETGLSLGTPHYMSPEQATAEKHITNRSDIYSLGAVLYEMLTGEPPHTGTSAQQIIVRIIAEPAEPVTRYRKSVPPNVAAALAKALEKLPADRFESVKAFAEALTNEGFRYVSRTVGGGVTTAVTASALPSRRRQISLVLGGVAVGAIAAVGWQLLRPAPLRAPGTSPTVRTVLSGIDIGRTLSGGWRIAISRDGKTWVAGGANSLLYVRRSDDTTFRPIPGTQNATSPSISPDGAWIVFHQNGAGLAKVLLAGGPVLPVTDRGYDPDWYDDDSILYRTADGLRVVGAAGGAPRAIAGDTLRKERPFMLPGHRGILYDNLDGVNVFDLKTGKSSLLEKGGSNARYLPGGVLLYGERSRQAVFAAPFDLKTLEVTGSPVPVLPSVAISGGGAVQLTVSDNGVLVYIVGAGTRDSNRQNRFVWIDTTGARTQLPLASGSGDIPRLSHDGTRIAFDDQGAEFIYDLTTGTRVEVDAEANMGLWSPSDSDVYVTHRQRRMSLRIPTEGNGRPQAVAHEMNGPIVGVSPDGKWILSENFVGKSAPDIYVSRADSLPLRPRPYLRADWAEIQPVVSPDGHWLAYVSNQTGREEVYIRSFPVPGPAVSVSTGGGEAPMWAPHGSALYYATPKAMYRVALRLGTTVSILGSKRLFPLSADMRIENRRYLRGIDIAPDGSRFLTTVLPTGDTTAASRSTGLGATIVVVNWFNELKAAMGAAGR